MRNEPRNNDSWKESKPDNNDVSNVEVIIILVRLSYHLTHNPEKTIQKKGQYSKAHLMIYYRMDRQACYAHLIFFICFDPSMSCKLLMVAFFDMP